MTEITDTSPSLWVSHNCRRRSGKIKVSGYCAQILGPCDRHGYKRDFLEPVASQGKRTVGYLLTRDGVYDSKSYGRTGNCDHRWWRVVDGVVTEIKQEQAEAIVGPPVMKTTVFATKLIESHYTVSMTVCGKTREDVLRRFGIWQSVVRQLQVDGWKIESHDLGEIKYEPEEYGDEGGLFYPGAGSFLIECTEEELDQVDWQKFKLVEHFDSDYFCFEGNFPIPVAEVVLTP